MSLLLALLLFAVPGAAFWSLLRGLDPVGRLVVSIAASIVLVAGTAQTMVMLGTWSQKGGLAAVLGLSAATATAGRVHRRRRATHSPVPPPRRPASAGANVTRQDIPIMRRNEEKDDWLFEE